MTDKTASERQRRRRERDRTKGLVDVTVKVPVEKAPEIKAIAARMREDAKGTESDHDPSP